jgi:hypothetical protein
MASRGCRHEPSGALDPAEKRRPTNKLCGKQARWFSVNLFTFHFLQSIRHFEERPAYRPTTDLYLLQQIKRILPRPTQKSYAKASSHKAASYASADHVKLSSRLTDGF